MRLAFDVRPLQYPGAHRGIGRYTGELLRELRKLPVQLLLLGDPGPLPAEFEELPRLAASAFRPPVRQLGWLLDEAWASHWSQFPVDLIHVTSPADLSFGWPVRCSTPVLVTLHDLFSVVPGPQGWRRFAVPVYRWLLWKLRFARHLVANSDTTADSFRAWLGSACPPVTTTWLGVSEPVPRSLPEEPFLLLFPCWPRYKNVEAVIEALAPLGAQGPALCIAGDCPPAFRHEMQQRARELPIRWTGFVEQRELERLLSVCRGFVFPSLREGFGLTVLEAMRHEAPVACTGRPPVSEVARGAALLFDPESPEQIRSACLTLWSSAEERMRLRRLGTERTHVFSWARTARETCKVYQAAIDRL